MCRYIEKLRNAALLAGSAAVLMLLSSRSAWAADGPLIYRHNHQPPAIGAYPAKVHHEPPTGAQSPALTRPEPDLAEPATVVGLVTRIDVRPRGIPLSHIVVELTSSQGYELLIDLGQSDAAREAAQLLGPLIEVTGHVKEVEGQTVLVAAVIYISHVGPT